MRNNIQREGARDAEAGCKGLIGKAACQVGFQGHGGGNLNRSCLELGGGLAVCRVGTLIVPAQSTPSHQIGRYLSAKDVHAILFCLGSLVSKMSAFSASPRSKLQSR